ncbi:MAG: hypothetical protein GY861_25350 [bacterium]|nr:hypothetical protein [bacterium]
MADKKLRDSKDNELLLINIDKELRQGQDSLMKIIREERLERDLGYDCKIPLQSRTPHNMNDLMASYNLSQVEIPLFDLNPFEDAIDSIRLEKMTDVDESVFAHWRPFDVPVMLLAGALGAGLSMVLKESFANDHNTWGRSTVDNGGHSGQDIDSAPGSIRPGGYGHRWKYGHDILNPFEVNWGDYFSGQKEMPGLALTVWYWIRHLIQDSFSSQGLPLPGHHRIRDWILDIGQNKEIMNILGSLKARDIAGAGLTNTLMGAYLWKTEKSLKRVIVKANYRAFSLMAGANLCAILVGLLLPSNVVSFNHACIPPFLYYGGRLVWMSHQIDKALEKRDRILNQNNNTLIEQENNLLKAEKILDFRKLKLNKNDELLKGFESLVRNSHQYTLENLAFTNDWFQDIKRWENIDSEDDLIATVEEKYSKIDKELING